MTEISERRHLAYTADELFDLVADIERYPEFLPWCDRLEILSRERGGERLIAEMTVSFKIYRERFKTEVMLDRAARAISIRYLTGPFKRLENEWRFEPEGEGATIDFFISFEFKSRALQFIVGMFFDEAFRRMVAAFDERAGMLYRKRQRAAVE
jgi:coenzyme Q-binding protein COQ10